MSKRSWPTLLMAGLLLVALLLGLAHFAGLATPDVYPNMSSLNAGPRGAKLLFDSLKSIEPLAVSRNFLSLRQWRPASTTILLLSFNPLRFNSAGKTDLSELEQLTRNNNRVVLCIPDHILPLKPDPKKQSLVRTRWGIQILQNEDKNRKEDDPDLVLDYDSSWRPVNGMDDAVEKRFGTAGSIVVALHSDDLSNENLATDTSALDEIPPLIGQHSSVAFDETHLGIEESGSIAALVRRYKLQGLVAGLLILAALFIWNQSVSFPPPPRFESRHDTRVVGADARDVFASLIARHLTPQGLVESCIAEWNRVQPRQRITTELPGKLDPVAAYRQLQESLKQKRSRI